jgi:lipopolysaccharide export system permease protein
MLKLIDKYILRQFLITFVYVVFIFISIIVVIDIIEKLEDFHNMPVPVEVIITQYYLNFIPYIANTISPIMVFIATVFVTSRMANRTEIVAILSSGVSYVRFLRPYLIGSSILAVITFYLINWVIPDANKVRVDFENTYIKSRYYFDQRNVHIQVAPEVYAYMESYDNIYNIGYRFTLERIQDGRLMEKLEAPRIVWDSTKNKWHIDRYMLRKINGMKEELSFHDGVDTTLNLSPEDFQSKHLFNEKLTLPELNEYIALLKLRGSENVQMYLIEKYLRFTYPFAMIILTVIGVLVSSRKSRRGVGAQIALGFVLAFIYILFFILSRAIANAGNMPAMLAVWLPNLVFAVIGLFIYRVTPK